MHRKKRKKKKKWNEKAVGLDSRTSSKYPNFEASELENEGDNEFNGNLDGFSTYSNRFQNPTYNVALENDDVQKKRRKQKERKHRHDDGTDTVDKDAGRQLDDDIAGLL